MCIFKKIALFGLLGLSCNVFGSVCTREIIMGWEEYKPYQYEETLNGIQTLTGFDIDITRAILNKMGCTVKFINMPWVREVDSIKQGQVDLASSANKTPEREKFAYFTEPYIDQTGFSLFVRKEDSTQYAFKQLSDLTSVSFILGVLRDYIYGDEYNKLLENPDFKTHLEFSGSLEQNIHKLENKRINGLLEDPFVFASTSKMLKLQDQFVPVLLMGSGSAHFMISRMSLKQNFVDAFNAALKQVRDSGEYQSIQDKYLK
jgi:polar amino acid transport system substrate-binding protein